MFRALRSVLVVVIVAAAVAYFLGYRLTPNGVQQTAERPVGTSGTPAGIDPSRARATGAAIGEKVAAGANEAQRAVADTALTAKIKSKMALDDTVKAASIDVHTTNGAVTLSGTVRSDGEHTRAVQLARETSGVTTVIDHLTVR